MKARSGKKNELRKEKIDFIGVVSRMYISRRYEDLSEIDFEDSENKTTISIESFCIKVIKTVNGMKYFYNDILIGAIDAVSHKHQIKCKESYKEVFDFVSGKLRELGW